MPGFFFVHVKRREQERCRHSADAWAHLVVECGNWDIKENQYPDSQTSVLASCLSRISVFSLAFLQS